MADLQKGRRGGRDFLAELMVDFTGGVGGRGRRRCRSPKGGVEALATHSSLKSFFNPFWNSVKLQRERKSRNLVGEKMTSRCQRGCHISSYGGVHKSVHPYNIFVKLPLWLLLLRTRKNVCEYSAVVWLKMFHWKSFSLVAKEKTDSYFLHV